MRTSSKSACTTTHLRARLRDSARQNPGAAESSPIKEQAAGRAQPTTDQTRTRARRDAGHTRELEPVPPETSFDPPSAHHSADESAASASRSLLIETEVSERSAGVENRSVRHGADVTDLLLLLAPSNRPVAAEHHAPPEREPVTSENVLAGRVGSAAVSAPTSRRRPPFPRLTGTELSAVRDQPRSARALRGCHGAARRLLREERGSEQSPTSSPVRLQQSGFVASLH